MSKILLQHIVEFFLQLCLGVALGSFFYNFFTKIYLRGRQWSTTMPDMLKEDKATSIIFLLTGVVLLSITIFFNLFYNPFLGCYLISFFVLIIGSSSIFPPKGKKIAENCYVMIYHIHNFIVTLNGHKIFIKGKRLRGNPDQIIYKEASPKWLPPHENDPVSREDYEYMLKAILKFLRKKKVVIRQA
jgi:hypothetical protein